MSAPLAHTPGPWIVIESGFGTSPNYLVCEDVPGHLRPICAAEHEHPNAEANARAIAAMPDLLGALMETWRVLRAAGTLHLSNGVQLGQTAWYVKISDAEALSDAALAKATGDVS